MSRNLTTRYLRETEQAIARAVSISDVTRIARIVGGYRLTRSNGALVARQAHRTELAEALHRVRAENFTSADLAWFARPIGGAL